MQGPASSLDENTQDEAVKFLVWIFVHILSSRLKMFEDNILEIDEIIARLENGDLSLDDAIKDYEKAMKLLKKSTDLLNKAEGKVKKVIEKTTGEIEITEV